MSWIQKVFKLNKSEKVTVGYVTNGEITPYPGIFTPKNFDDTRVVGMHRWGRKTNEITQVTLDESGYKPLSADLSAAMDWIFESENTRARVEKLPISNSERTTETENSSSSESDEETSKKRRLLMTEEEFNKKLAEAIAQQMAKNQEDERIKAAEQASNENANAKAGNNCLHNLMTIGNMKCKSLPANTTRKSEAKVRKIEKNAAIPAYLPKKQVVEGLISFGQAASLSKLFHLKNGVYRVKNDPMDTVLGPISVCKECSRSNYYGGGTETLCMRPSQAGNRAGTCPICRDPFNISGRRAVVGSGGLCQLCVVPRLEMHNECFMIRLLKRPLEMATGCKVNIFKEKEIDPDEEENDRFRYIDFIIEFRKNNQIVAVIGLEIDALSHQGEARVSEMKKNRLFFAWAKEAYGHSVRSHMIRFAPDSPQFDTSTWVRYVFLRSLMILFFYKKHEFPENGSMTYMYYNPNSTLIPIDMSGVGILNGGARFDETDQSMPDWATFCDPAFLAFKSLSSKDSEQPRVVCHLSKCKTKAEIYGAMFGVKTRFGKDMR